MQYMEHRSPDLSLDPGYRRGDEAPEGTCSECTLTVQQFMCRDTGWHSEMEPFQLTHFALRSLPQPSPGSVPSPSLQSLSSASPGGLVKTHFASLYPVISLFLSLGSGPRICISDKGPDDADTAGPGRTL